MFGMGKKEPTQEATTHGDHSPITQQIHSGSGDNIEGDKICPVSPRYCCL